jgi:hypothetical protein
VSRPALELLRPPPHRGPLIAAGAVVLTTGLVLEEIRLQEALPSGVHLLLLALAAGLVFGLGAQARADGGAPRAYQSVLLVTGLLLLELALLRLAHALGADFDGRPPAGTVVWTSLLLAAAALWASMAKRSAVCLLVAAIAVGAALLAALDWIFGADSQGPYRVLLLLLAIVLVLASLLLRGGSPRHGEQLVNAAGLAILAIPVMALAGAAIGLLGLFGAPPGFVLPGFWELVVLAAGCGLVAYGAVDRAPGAAYLGVANLAAFVVCVGVAPNDTLRWWPLVLLLLGAGAMAAGLRPRDPLPPEPHAYGAGEGPLAARTDAEEITLRVRDDSAPR